MSKQVTSFRLAPHTLRVLDEMVETLPACASRTDAVTHAVTAWHRQQQARVVPLPEPEPPAPVEPQISGDETVLLVDESGDGPVMIKGYMTIAEFAMSGNPMALLSAQDRAAFGEWLELQRDD